MTPEDGAGARKLQGLPPGHSGLPPDVSPSSEGRPARKALAQRASLSGRERARALPRKGPDWTRPHRPRPRSRAESHT